MGSGTRAEGEREERVSNNISSQNNHMSQSYIIVSTIHWKIDNYKINL